MERIRYEEFPSRLRAARERLGRTLAEVALEIGTSKSYLSQLERGVIENPNAGMLRRICNSLGIEVIFGKQPRSLDSRKLGYGPPIKGEQEEVVLDARGNRQSAVRNLQKALSDARISIDNRCLLERQVNALIDVIREHRELTSAGG